ncbi:MAG: class I SAM-dependent methyltransferase [bacterium]|nr:class I SAM-dependent methyltransferase [bacterium]
MAELPTFHDELLMPLTIGSPFRVADYAYPNWGLQYSGEQQALAAYKTEWSTDATRMAQVTQATVAAGLGDYPQLLRHETAKTVHDIVQRHHQIGDSRIILDIGSGPGLSALEVYQHLPAGAKERTTVWLLDPSTRNLDAAMALMEQNNIRNSELFEGTDSEILPQFKEGSVDMITAVASVHHHSQIPFGEHLRVLKLGGFAVYADWHQPIWEHPGSVLKFLQAFDEAEWPNREEGLRHWVEVYPQAKDAPSLPDNPVDIKAIEGITNFWRAYARIVNSEGVGNELWPLEGHRPVQKYVDAMTEAGFAVNPPVPLLNYSSLLQVTVAQKV